MAKQTVPHRTQRSGPERRPCKFVRADVDLKRRRSLQGCSINDRPDDDGSRPGGQKANHFRGHVAQWRQGFGHPALNGGQCAAAGSSGFSPSGHVLPRHRSAMTGVIAESCAQCSRAAHRSIHPARLLFLHRNTRAGTEHHRGHAARRDHFRVRPDIWVMNAAKARRACVGIIGFASSASRGRPLLAVRPSMSHDHPSSGNDDSLPRQQRLRALGGYCCAASGCSAPGGCKTPATTNCVGPFEPVCGCDNKNYLNASCADASQMRVQHDGYCTDAAP